VGDALEDREVDEVLLVGLAEEVDDLLRRVGHRLDDPLDLGPDPPEQALGAGAAVAAGAPVAILRLAGLSARHVGFAVAGAPVARLAVVDDAVAASREGA